MSKWSGFGIPPTRRKLKRYRQQQLAERAEMLKDGKVDQSRFDREWKRMKGDKLLERWGDV